MTTRIPLSRCIALALACAGIGSTQAAPAVSVNPLGVGQVLLYPYYTVNHFNDTYLSVVNTTPQGKAVVMRFLEGYNSRTTLEFSIYLSPYDIWTGALVAIDGNSSPALLTRDSSCTVPNIRGNTALPQLPDGTRYVPFRNFQYSGLNADGGPSNLARAREGFLEVIEMGTLAAGSTPTQVLEEASHASSSHFPNSGVPIGCDRILANWDNINGAWGGANGNRQLDIGLPSGGLYGSATVINVGNGTLHTYDAEALVGFYGGTAAPGGLHFAPGSGRPTLADANQGGSTVDSVVTLADGSALRSSWSSGTADAVSAALMVDAIYNEFDTEAGIAAASEWILTYPTKRFYADRPNGAAALAPFGNSISFEPRGCDFIAPSYWDREELPLQGSGDDDQNTYTDRICTLPSIGGVPPPLPGYCRYQSNQCGGINLLSFNQQGVSAGGPSAIFGSSNGVDYEPRAANLALDRGHFRIAFPTGVGQPAGTHQMTSLDGDVYTGLPVIGFWSANYVNGNAQAGKLANYSGAVRHRGVRNVTGS